MSSELLLALALPAVYLADSAYFLSVGEALIRTRSGRACTLGFGWPFELAGRRPYLPNPLTPFRPLLRVQWTTAAGGGAPAALSAEMRAHLAALRPIGWLASACAALIVLLAPLALALGAPLIFVASALACLALALASCTLLVLRRRQLGLSPLQLLSAIIVSLVCLPCAANLARALAAQRRWSVAAADLPALGFDGPRVAAARAQVRQALALAQRLLADDRAACAALGEQLRRLEAVEGAAREAH
jgi:hypothetical protein